MQRQGDEGEPLLRLLLPPQAQNNVVVDLIYPPDATPPQVLTVSTAGIASTRAFEQPEAATPPTANDGAPVVDDSDVLSDSTAETLVVPAVENERDLQEASPANAAPDPARPMNEAAVDAERP